MTRIKAPTNLLFANTTTRAATSSPLARTRKVRTRVSADTRRIGVFDISARAGLLFDLLDVISRKQRRFTFYPVEAPVPMGLGVIGDERIAELKKQMPGRPYHHLKLNLQVEDIAPLLEQTRKGVEVDLLAGLVGPMLAFIEDGELRWNYFSVPVGENVVISVSDLREYAGEARRPFEAAVAILVLAQVWAKLYDHGYHEESRGCPFDFCESRHDLVGTIRHAELCGECMRAIPREDLADAQKCLSAVRDYTR